MSATLTDMAVPTIVQKVTQIAETQPLEASLARPSDLARGSHELRCLCRRCCLPFVFLLPLYIGIATSLAEESRFPIVVSGGAHALTVPWHPRQVTRRLNPAITVGTERTLRSGDRVRLYHTANLGFFQHYWWMTGVFVDTELGADYALPRGFHAELRLGLGYLHYFWRRETLELRDGVYVPARDWGKPSVMVPLTIALGYNGSTARPLAVAPFIAAQWAVQAPFADEAPVMTHFFLLFGVRIHRGGAAPAAGS